ncbi:MAG: DNA translocase FtsK, partial [Planctomycetota bacterium]|nr:DNA translocase FtsK [Planctomycetota bacterium]
EEEVVAGAPQVFDPEALKAKMSKLPIIFGNENKKIATDKDLAAMQAGDHLVEDPNKPYKFPGLDLLEIPEENFSDTLKEHVATQGAALMAALQEYRIEGRVVDAESGPAVTMYNIKLAPGTKVSALSAVQSDIARAIKAVNIRIVPNMAGRDTIGVEVPNVTREKVRLKELMSHADVFTKMKLPMFLGKDAGGTPLIQDLAKMPHMLIAGTTGSGKSVCMNTIIMGFLYTKRPSELKLVLVDPKMVEMSQFKDIPHLMCPVVTEMPKAAAILDWACNKMEERYATLQEAGCRDIASYNELTWEELKERLEPQTPEDEAAIPRKLPYIVIVIDELADLMMTHREVEGSIIRIAQKARAVGIHLILATQRPQREVVTGLIKANMPARMTFKVSSGMDSRIVLDHKGGELLLGQGDMLFLTPSSNSIMRAQGTLVDDREIRRVVKFMKEVASPSFERSLMQIRANGTDEQRIADSQNNSSASLEAAKEDPMFHRAVEIVLETKRGSVSLLQRRLAIGYTRSSRLIDLMGIAGIISDHKGSVARDVLITLEEWQAMQKMMEEQAKAQGITLQREDGPGTVLPATPAKSSLFEEEAPFDSNDEAPPTADVRVMPRKGQEQEEDAL